jgi:hypothetical protein
MGVTASLGLDEFGNLFGLRIDEADAIKRSFASFADFLSIGDSGVVRARA